MTKEYKESKKSKLEVVSDEKLAEKRQNQLRVEGKELIDESNSLVIVSMKKNGKGCAVCGVETGDLDGILHGLKKAIVRLEEGGDVARKDIAKHIEEDCDDFWKR